MKKVGDDYAIILNEDGMPRLRINSYYRSVIGQGDEARRYVEDRMRSAVWLIKSIQQRQKTLYKVTHSIVQFQRAFLDKGLPHLRPLSLRDVAEDIRMHESTVSRVTTEQVRRDAAGGPTAQVLLRRPDRIRMIFPRWRRTAGSGWTSACASRGHRRCSRIKSGVLSGPMLADIPTAARFES